MEIHLLSESKDGSIIRRKYSCPCGRGIIEEEQYYTPGHRDTFVQLRCKECKKHYSIQFGDSHTKWKLYHDYTTYYNKDIKGGLKMNNLAVKTFSVLRDLFFDEAGNPIKFELREKRNTQDDPFDEYIAASLDDQLRHVGAYCQRSSGPLISPDMAVVKTGIDLSDSSITNNPDAIIGIEVKKLERGNNGGIARPTGMDYNSTPPCGRVRIYTADDKPLIIKGFYLFACLEADNNGKNYVSAMCLCDGSILNDDFDLYMQITGSREKGINIGTYGDGANRNRPMLLFSNPLGSELLDHRITLISGLDLLGDVGNIELAWRFIRKDTQGADHTFFVYMDERDFPNNHRVTDVIEPFPVPRNRVSETQGRGKFRLQAYYERLNAIWEGNHNN